jgi:DNA-binding MltR family transcriptional regulator
MADTPEDNTDWVDSDIEALTQLGYGEKAGLQIYRNYTEAFEKHSIKEFIKLIDAEPIDLTDLTKLTELIVSEDVRFLPVIVCAFADDLLRDVFKRVLPEGIPGGSRNMLSGFGPLSDLSKRIQLAYAFDVLSRDLMLELDRLRTVRNRVSHSWTIPDLEQFLTDGPLAKMHKMEELLTLPEQLKKELAEGKKLIVALRLRLVWVTGRLVYEAAAYNRTKAARLSPVRTLYGESKPVWLQQIAVIASDATRRIAAQGE